MDEKVEKDSVDLKADAKVTRFGHKSVVNMSN